MSDSTLDDALARIAELERRLDAMADEVRTRRLVVVDADGAERIVGECRSDLRYSPAELRVCDPSDDTYIALQTDADGGWTPGLYMWVAGNNTAMLAATRRPAFDVTQTTLHVGDRLIADELTDRLGGAPFDQQPEV